MSRRSEPRKRAGKDPVGTSIRRRFTLKPIPIRVSPTRPRAPSPWPRTIMRQKEAAAEWPVGMGAVSGRTHDSPPPLLAVVSDCLVDKCQLTTTLSKESNSSRSGFSVLKPTRKKPTMAFYGMTSMLRRCCGRVVLCRRGLHKLIRQQRGGKKRIHTNQNSICRRRASLTPVVCVLRPLCGTKPGRS